MSYSPRKSNSRTLPAIRAVFDQAGQGREQIRQDHQRIIVDSLYQSPIVIEPTTEKTASSTIWKLLKSGLLSPSAESHTPATRYANAKAVSSFVSWLDSRCEVSPDDTNVFRLFDSYKMDELDCVTNQSTLRLISVLRHAQRNRQASLSREEHKTIERLCNSVNRVENGGHAPSVCDWFLEIPWLRQEMESRGLENQYLKLESPRIVLQSMHVLYGTVLAVIEEFRRTSLAQRKPTNDEIDDDLKLMSLVGNRSQLYRASIDHADWFAPIVSGLGSSSPCREYFFATRFGKAAAAASVRTKEHPDGKIPTEFRHNDTRPRLLSPKIFNRAHLFLPTELEQLIVAQLIASLAVQPDFARRLRLRNAVMIKSPNGRPRAIQFVYQKSRARGQTKRTAIIDSSSIVGRALISYVNLVKRAQTLLPESDKFFLTPSFSDRYMAMTIGRPSIGSAISPINLLVYCLEQPGFQHSVWRQFKKEQSSSVFYDAFLTLMTSAEYSASESRRLFGRNNETIAKVLPFSSWKTLALKQLGVFARSDRYRVGDLTNVNSHSAETERLNYLTDYNKDWVNRNGRITRIIINDLERYVFKPNVDKAHRAAYERMLRTEVLDALDVDTDVTDLQIESIRPDTLDAEAVNCKKDFNNIVVIDHPTTVVYLLHFLAQAETFSRRLALSAPDFFEFTVAPMCEWMERLLTERLSPQSVRDGKHAYDEAKQYLPPLFADKLCIDDIE